MWAPAQSTNERLTALLRPIHPPERCVEDGVLLRRYRDDDGPAFYDLVVRNTDRLAPYFPGIMQQVKSPSDANRYVRDRRREWDKRQTFFYAVCDEASGEQIGQVRFKSVDWTTGRSEIAYFIDRGYEGRCRMAAALRALLAVGFEELGLKHIFARITSQNARSRRVLELCGFSPEGVLHADFRTLTGELADVLYFAIQRENYVAFRAAEAAELSR